MYKESQQIPTHTTGRIREWELTESSAIRFPSTFQEFSHAVHDSTLASRHRTMLLGEEVTVRPGGWFTPVVRTALRPGEARVSTAHVEGSVAGDVSEV
jgi:hypothetical protein